MRMGYGVVEDEGIEAFVHPLVPGRMILFDFKDGQISEEDLRIVFDLEGIDVAPFFAHLESL